ncbi:peptidoglycan-binding protein [Pseudomonas sp. FP453]|uniref:FimV/HubP family polar landmark protein n=1 Tax=Pseudomonas sp. FP453 TaxID=2954094 RepID=UPI00273278DE|nr:FimV/HubP family polar landmark protein [Pseudomonas sp. FP453]WLH88653.1 peptidoglycan-binding protein [Pseudomonas sp. FP453]
MVQVRKLVLAIAAASALSSGMAQALQLGEMTLKSQLNQPLSVEIELLDVGGLTASEITPSLASSQAFVDAGVDRQAFLNDLVFTPVINPSGRSVVRVTSSKPLPESYVRFLLQVQWPNGRLMRDYSVLLDPAKFDQPAATAPAPRVLAPASPAPAAPAASKAAQHTTTSRDTLWEIAAKNRNGGSIQQTMLAIQALNPDAFIDGNINRLKTGQVLRLPDTVQSTALPQPQAIAEVTAQNAAWRQGRRGATNQVAGKQQLDATKRTQAGNAPSSTNAKDNLSLVSAESAKQGAKGKAADGRALSDKLAMTQEELDTTRRDNAELKSRAADLQSQLDKLQKLIQLKNDQLARLQAEKGDPAAVPAVIPAQLAGDPAAATPAAPSAPAATPAPTAPAPEPVKPEAGPASNDGKFNELLTNPVVLGVVGGAAALVALLLLLLVLRHRNARREEEKHLRMARALAEEPEFTSNIDQDLPPDSFEGLEVPAPSVKLAAAPVPAPVVEPAVVVPTVASVLAPLAVAVAPMNSNDALAQAQSLVDRGHLNQAADVLEQAIKQEPKRSDLRLKLMEVYGLQSDKDGFVTQERQLVANGDNHAQVELLKSRFPAMAVLAAGVSAAVAAAALDAQYVKDLLEDKPAAPAPEPEAFDTDFDLSLDDLEAVSPAEVNPEDVLTFESVLQQQAEAKASPDDLSDFDLDLQLDAPASTQADDDFLSGLEEQMQDVPAVEPPTLTPAALDEFELPEDFDLSLADEPETATKPDAFASELDDVNAELDRLSQSLEHPSIEPSFTAEDAALGGDEPEFDFLSGTDEVATKLDLAQAYIDMGDADGARDILSEVLTEGDESQRGEAKEMLGRI